MLLRIGEAQLHEDSLFLPGGFLKLGCKNAIMFCTFFFQSWNVTKWLSKIWIKWTLQWILVFVRQACPLMLILFKGSNRRRRPITIRWTGIFFKYFEYMFDFCFCTSVNMCITSRQDPQRLLLKFQTKRHLQFEFALP